MFKIEFGNVCNQRNLKFTVRYKNMSITIDSPYKDLNIRVGATICSCHLAVVAAASATIRNFIEDNNILRDKDGYMNMEFPCAGCGDVKTDKCLYRGQCFHLRMENVIKSLYDGNIHPLDIKLREFLALPAVSYEIIFNYLKTVNYDEAKLIMEELNYQNIEFSGNHQQSDSLLLLLDYDEFKKRVMNFIHMLYKQRVTLRPISGIMDFISLIVRRLCLNIDNLYKKSNKRTEMCMFLDHLRYASCTDIRKTNITLPKKLYATPYNMGNFMTMSDMAIDLSGFGDATKENWSFDYGYYTRSHYIFDC